LSCAIGSLRQSGTSHPRGVGSARRADDSDDPTRWLASGELVERYSARSGRDLSGLKFYEVFALFKIAGVVQRIYHRFVSGQTDDPRFANLGERVSYLALRAASWLWVTGNQGLQKLTLVGPDQRLSQARTRPSTFSVP
jgi:hypothetical protein